jgi:hypothetical protein
LEVRVKVTPETIDKYGLDTITGNTREDLLTRVTELAEHDMELWLNIPDAFGGSTEEPTERNTFEHFANDLPEPEGKAHEHDAFNLMEQALSESPCGYRWEFVPTLGRNEWVCVIHHEISKHSIDTDLVVVDGIEVKTTNSHAPCLIVDPYEI